LNTQCDVECDNNHSSKSTALHFDLAFELLSASVSFVFMVRYTFFTLALNELSLVGLALDLVN